jgi:hypothetical protein
MSASEWETPNEKVSFLRLFLDKQKEAKKINKNRQGLLPKRLLVPEPALSLASAHILQNIS